MALKNLWWRYHKDGVAQTGWNASNTNYAGKNKNGNYVTELSIELDKPATAITISGQTAGLNEAKTHGLAFKLSAVEGDSNYVNANYNTPNDGEFTTSSAGAASFTINGNFKANTYYYVYIFDGSYYGVYNASIFGGASFGVSTVNATEYTLAISAGAGSSISVDRTASNFAGTGALANNAKIYAGDKIKPTFTAQGGFALTSATINGNSAASGAEYIVAGNTTVASAASALDPFYTVTLNGQGATSQGTASVSVKNGQAMPAIDKPSKRAIVSLKINYDGGQDTELSSTHTFNGYFSAINGGGTKYYNADGTSAKTYDKTANMTLYAHWTASPILLPNKSRNDYDFMGWYTAASGGTKVGGGDEQYTPAADISLYAQWQFIKQYIWKAKAVTAISNSADSVVRGIWSGYVGDREVLCVACNGFLWELDNAGGVWSKVACGAISTSSDMFMFGFEKKLYLLNGTEYKVWNGTTLADVTGYRPMVLVGCKPAGGGQELEQTNLMTGARRALFSPDGTATTFVLPEKDLNSIDYVRVVATNTNISGWTPDLANGELTFGNAPAAGTNSLEIGWTVKTDQLGLIKAMKAAEVFNGASGTSVFLYGTTNRAYYSGLDYDGNARADYFPELNFCDIGESNTPITGIVRHYNRLLVFKPNSAWTISAGTAITLSDGRMIGAYKVAPLNREIGNIAFAQAVLVENYPRTLDGRSVYAWHSITDYGNSYDRNAQRISERVDRTIRTFDLETAKAYYDKYNKEYYVIGANGTALVHSIVPDAWAVYTGFMATCLINYKDELYFGTADGNICHFADSYLSDNGEAINAVWESGAMAFGKDFEKKYSAMLWIALKPDTDGYLDITAETDNRSEFANYPADAPDTGDMPKTKRLKLKAKKFTYYKLKLTNDKADKTATIVAADIKIRGTGYVR